MWAPVHAVALTTTAALAAWYGIEAARARRARQRLETAIDTAAAKGIRIALRGGIE
ncbi:hypothetical protein Afil01_62380 [Actinorhabdospora filicis]|uniref:Uncharacterized protein n=1 Tax=Actinorhabdospora filicis TaxID=1785913 RepID=A0A9W6SVC4_9ACTN|nr:hypothetical protein [Actinorhabdospora filicis]GLZ81431.1 hypothetical protein Afil01_62380 [Actinorhabdospora filicis]